MFQYYNPHPYGLLVDDCVKRAIAVTTGIDYMDVQRGLNAHKKVTGAKKFNTDGNPRSYVENVLGFASVTVSKKGDGTRITAEDFCKVHPKGRYIISLPGHWSAVINGTIIDTWDCCEKSVLSYFEVKPIVPVEKVPIKNGFIIKDNGDGTANVSFYDSSGNKSVKIIPAQYADGYRACLLDMGRHEAIDWADERWK